LQERGELPEDFTVAVEIRDDLSKDDTPRIATVENLQRQNLTPLEEAGALHGWEGRRQGRNSGSGDAVIAAEIGDKKIGVDADIEIEQARSESEFTDEACASVFCLGLQVVDGGVEVIFDGDAVRLNSMARKSVFLKSSV
jgi:hypothetical protein